VVWLIFALHRPQRLIDAARSHHENDEDAEGGCCHHEHHHDSGGEKPKLVQVADAFFMDGSMLWKEIIIGVLLAGFLMVLVPANGWQGIFMSHGPYAVRLFENALVGPLIAMASFVCSVGNIPLASLLWSSGATFGGVIAFIYGDLIVLPLIFAYRKYYGTTAALYITAILYASMVAAGIVVDLLFAALGLTPQGGPGRSAMEEAGFSWNYTTWLDLVAILVGGGLVFLHLRNPGGHEAQEHHPHAHGHAAHHGPHP
jgi:uncharacterized membrane protein YraQ (UPF0718 family)